MDDGVRERVDGREHRYLFCRKLVALGEMGRLVVAHERLAVVFPNEDLEGKIECDERCGLHERRPGRGVAEENELRVRKVFAHASGLTAVIDDIEDLDSPGLEHFEQALERISGSPGGWPGHHTFPLQSDGLGFVAHFGSPPATRTDCPFRSPPRRRKRRHVRIALCVIAMFWRAVMVAA